MIHGSIGEDEQLKEVNDILNYSQKLTRICTMQELFSALYTLCIAFQSSKRNCGNATFCGENNITVRFEVLKEGSIMITVEMRPCPVG
jgi:hypothetical protein